MTDYQKQLHDTDRRSADTRKLIHDVLFSVLTTKSTECNRKWTMLKGWRPGVHFATRFYEEELLFAHCVSVGRQVPTMKQLEEVKIDQSIFRRCSVDL